MLRQRGTVLSNTLGVNSSHTPVMSVSYLASVWSSFQIFLPFPLEYKNKIRNIKPIIIDPNMN